jgi:CheY-like chemotaxis protein
VIEASNGPEALELWKLEGDRIDLLLTDLVMPGGIGGQELAVRLKRDKQTLKVILTSGHSFESVGRENREDGLKVISKPYDLRELADALRASLDGC